VCHTCHLRCCAEDASDGFIPRCCSWLCTSTMYDNPSASQSTTSLSEEEDDNVNKSTFFQDPIAVAPAKWSHPRRPSLTSTTAPIARLPTEILIHVLRYLHTSRELYRCMLVCRTWCECSVELLWHKPSFPGVSTLIKMMRVLSNEDQAFTYARFIRRLNFCFLGPELSDVLFGRVALCVRLERLTLVNCRSLTDDAMTRVFHWFPSLVAIDLTGVVEASDRAIIALATSSKRLQGINLGGCKKVSDRGILALAHGCPLLRRVKLSGLELVTDDAIVALAHGCPLILEIDLNQCSRITDRAIRELWTHSFHMREMRLSYCEDLTNLAFPAPVRPELATSAEHDGPNPFPASLPGLPDFPPLQLPRRFDHLRMLDLTSCSLIMDEAIEGIITHAPKIRNLVLAKCSLLTDKSIESISKLGKHLHYLHLGHCSNITDASVKNLARACTRLRYIDLASKPCMWCNRTSTNVPNRLHSSHGHGRVRAGELTETSTSRSCPGQQSHRRGDICFGRAICDSRANSSILLQPHHHHVHPLPPPEASETHPLVSHGHTCLPPT
jgi:F-box and leucine-rich repeat protein GRR1